MSTSAIAVMLKVDRAVADVMKPYIEPPPRKYDVVTRPKRTVHVVAILNS
jgi:hypothetical protein